MFMVISRRRSPSTANLPTPSRSLSMASSFRSLILVAGLTPACSQIRRARECPMPKTAVSAISACLWLGIFTPAIRAMKNSVRTKTKYYIDELLALARHPSTLTLLVARFTANDADHTLALNDLAFTTNLLDRGLNTHARLLLS